MTLINRLVSVFSRTTTSPAPVTPPVVFSPVPVFTNKFLAKQPESESSLSVPSSAFLKSEPLPTWLTDDESVRDEGVLFGLSDTRPDGKLAEIRATFAHHAAPLEELIELHTEKIGELTLFIEQHENHIISLRDDVTELRNSEPVANSLVRTVVSLCLSVVMCIGNFYLIDETLRPSFPNQWIAVGIFLAGMFNLFSRTSFFYETNSRLSGRRIIEEVGLPLATSIFILVQALQTQSAGQSIGLFVFIFFLFLLSGKLLLSTLVALQNDVAVIRKNHQLTVNKEQNLPIWESEIERLTREVDSIRAQKWPIVTALNHAEANRNQLNTQRDRLVNLFMSEFELARSLRERLSEQQRKVMINYE